MVIRLNKKHILHHTERYQADGLSQEFLGEMSRAVSALQAAGYEPYDQLYGYAMHGNDRYITRFGGAREIVTKMDVKDTVERKQKYYLVVNFNLQQGDIPYPGVNKGKSI